ncbi:18045_t:CDS:2, partial [Funneliformis geosporum]
TSLRNHDENESNTKIVNIVHDQEKISLKNSVQKMPERLNEDVSQRESDSGLVTEIVRDLLQGFLVDDFQREFINTKFINREHSNSSPLFEYDYDPIALKKIKGIGWHMVNRVTYSADSIFRLTNLQI